jgi:hypothetical protein
MVMVAGAHWVSVVNSRVSFICDSGRALFPDTSLIVGVRLAHASSSLSSSSSSFCHDSVGGSGGQRVAGAAPGMRG